MITLVPITRENAAVYKRIRLAALQDTPTAFGSTYAKEVLLTDAEWLERAKKFNGEAAIAYLACDGANACGIVGGHLDAEGAAAVHLVSMWIAPTHRRLGAGRMLVTAILTWASKKNARAVHLLVTSNNAAAISFYEQIGFAKTGKTVPYPNDPALVEYEMIRAITQSPAEETASGNKS